MSHFGGAAPRPRDFLEKNRVKLLYYGDEAITVLSRQPHNLSFLGELEGGVFRKKVPFL